MKLAVEESEFIPCDILDIVRRIRRHNPVAAVRFVEAFKSSVDLLARMPDFKFETSNFKLPSPTASVPRSAQAST